MSTPPASLRAAIVGAGLMGRWHARAIAQVGGHVVAVVDRDVARAKALAAQLPTHPVCVAELGALLHGERLDVVHVCAPLAAHAALVEEGIAAGVHLLVEKPLAEDASMVERLHALAEARGVSLCPVHQFLFQPGVLDAARALPTLGPVRMLDVVACSAGADEQGDFAREAIALDILPHGLALARRLLGRTLSETEWEVSGGAAGEIRAVATLGDTSVVLSVSMHARPTENSLTVRCDAGTVRANLFHGYATIERGKPSRADKALRPFISSATSAGAAFGNLLGRSIRRETAYPGLRELVRRFHEACAGRGPLPISVEESVDVARARDTIAARRAPIAI